MDLLMTTLDLNGERWAGEHHRTFLRATGQHTVEVVTHVLLSWNRRCESDPAQEILGQPFGRTADSCSP